MNDLELLQTANDLIVETINASNGQGAEPFALPFGGQQNPKLRLAEVILRYLEVSIILTNNEA